LVITKFKSLVQSVQQQVALVQSQRSLTHFGPTDTSKAQQFFSGNSVTPLQKYSLGFRKDKTTAQSTEDSHSVVNHTNTANIHVGVEDGSTDDEQQHEEDDGKDTVMDLDVQDLLEQ